MKPIVTDACISCGACADICPDVFVMGDDDLAHPKIDYVDEALAPCAREACEACPVDAIILEE